jgi:hypothetical protein
MPPPTDLRPPPARLPRPPLPLPLQLTQKKSSLQFKALDNTLQTVDRRTGERQSLPYRCADMDKCAGWRGGWAVEAAGRGGEG